MEKRFSVIVCTYNRDEYLVRSLESLANQRCAKAGYEILIVDNNSTDKTAAVSDVFIQQHTDTAIRYILEPDQGISFARNRGIKEAKGEFIIFIDDDETVDATYLDQLDKYLQAYPQAALCGTPVVPVYEGEKPDWLSPFIARLFTGEYNKGDSVKILSAKDCPGTGHAIIRKALFDKHGYFNTDLGRKGDSLMGAEDKDMFLRLMDNRVACYYFPALTIYHHILQTKLTDDFFRRITYALGKSECVRTKNISNAAYLKRLLQESIKWAASFILSIGYLFTFRFSKGIKLLQFRWNVTRGLLGG